MKRKIETLSQLEIKSANSIIDFIRNGNETSIFFDFNLFCKAATNEYICKSKKDFVTYIIYRTICAQAIIKQIEKQTILGDIEKFELEKLMAYLSKNP